MCIHSKSSLFYFCGSLKVRSREKDTNNSKINMPLPEIEEIFQKYRNEEDKVESLLNEKFSSEKCHKVPSPDKDEFPSVMQIKERNKRLLNDLEAAKGRLRSKAIFCPTEVQWENICRKYQENPSLPVTTWKCHIPVFV